MQVAQETLMEKRTWYRHDPAKQLPLVHSNVYLRRGGATWFRQHIIGSMAVKNKIGNEVQNMIGFIKLNLSPII